MSSDAPATMVSAFSRRVAAPELRLTDAAPFTVVDPTTSWCEPPASCSAAEPMVKTAESPTFEMLFVV
jgi:hypothetical protein